MVSMTQEEVDALFARASTLISGLPSYRDPETFYDIADTRSSRAKSAWSSAADILLKIAANAPDEKKFYFRYWAGDAYIGLGEL